MQLRTGHLALVLSVALIVLTGCAAPEAEKKAPSSSQSSGSTSTTSPTGGAMQKSYSSPPPMSINASKQYQAVLSTTEGDITIQLFTEDAPITANNFIFLAKENFYDGVRFHRIIKGFMIQSGDPQGTGSGGPGYRFQDEPVKKDYQPGIIAMANAGPNTNGSQFFIMHGDYSGRLPKNYTIFGQVVQGLDVVEKIANTPVGQSPMGEQSTPTKEVLIKHVEIKEQ